MYGHHVWNSIGLRGASFPSALTDTKIEAKMVIFFFWFLMAAALGRLVGIAAINVCVRQRAREREQVWRRHSVWNIAAAHLVWTLSYTIYVWALVFCWVQREGGGLRCTCWHRASHTGMVCLMWLDNRMQSSNENNRYNVLYSQIEEV